MDAFFNMENLLNLINDDNVNAIGSVFKLLLSMTLGAAVGLERRHKGQIAGMRTLPSSAWVPPWPCWCPSTFRRN